MKRIRILFSTLLALTFAASAFDAAQTQTPQRKARVCMDTPEYRQFDFWVGDRDVLGPSGQRLGTNKVVLLQDGCIVEENWTSARGGTGQSFNFYNPVTNKWHQSYMDNNGDNWMMDGEYKGGVPQHCHSNGIFLDGSSIRTSPLRIPFSP